MPRFEHNTLTGFESGPGSVVAEAGLDDAELLGRYARHKSGPAFRLLVERYVPLVYSAALRRVRDSALAEDLARVVFILLARNPTQPTLPERLAGWLCHTTHHTAAKVLRTRGQPGQFERETVNLAFACAETDWAAVAPFLDEAVAELDDLERNAVLLRWFRNRSLSEVERALDLPEAAAETTVSQAIEKLRRALWRRGVAVSLVALTGLLATHAAQIAPADLAASVAAAALGKTSLSTRVYTLLQDHREVSPIWPKVVSGIAAGIVTAGALYLAVHFWPQRSQDSTSVRFDSRIVMHPRRPGRPARAAQATAPISSPVLPSPGGCERPRDTAIQTNRFIPPLEPAALTNPVALPAVVDKEAAPGPAAPPGFAAAAYGGYGQVPFPGDPMPAPVFPQIGYPARSGYRPMNLQAPIVLQNGSGPWAAAQPRSVPGGSVTKNAPVRRR
jgi:RNA polymerase sigma factor (sigma-70 family)